MSPLLAVVLCSGLFCVFAWSMSVVTGDTSWVDRGWSILPVLYLWLFASFAHLRDPRLDVMAILVTLWGVRLTYNFARKGGYAGVEDYRWAVLRARMSRWQFQLFNVLFIVLYQNLILVLITLPAYSAYEHRDGSSYGAIDALLALAFISCTIAETIADQQQWDFHVAKHATLAAGDVPATSFLDSGLFRYSRHPNFFFELAQWWLLFLLGALAAGSLRQWSVIGVVLLTLLFVGSTRFTESISLSKYPAYADYQRRTSPVVPWRARAKAENSTP